MRRGYESLIIANGLLQKRVDHLEKKLLQLNKPFLRKRKVNYMGLE
ncbi:GSCOCG00011963001-RA-CDS [Cotesia congregata]|nr:GSCOCG00011963001-RA-CDS [Cotesia congregata]